jgi:putative phage-type endonuclease
MAISSYSDKEEWLKERQTGIGGSDAGVILGVNPFKTKVELWEEKRADAPVEIEMTPPMLRGIVLEPVAADLYVERTGRQVRRQPLRRHSVHEFMIGNVDRQILAVDDVQSTGILEIKCPGLRVMANVKARGLSDYMTVQLMHYLAVYGYEWGSFCLFNAENWDVIYFDLEADQKFIGAIVEMERDFWNDYVLTGTAPPEDDQPLIDIPEVEGELKVIDAEDWISAANELREAQGLRKAAAELEDTAKGTLKGLMESGGFDAVEISGLARLYYRMSAGRTSWKKTAAALAFAGKLDVDEFAVEGKPYRTFKPYFLTKEEE